MQPSIFNLRVPLPERGEVFLMNTLTDAQVVVSSDVADLLDRVAELEGGASMDDEARGALRLLADHGFVVESRDADRQALDRHLWTAKSDASELHVTILTTLQCNFACDYCFQGDHGDYNKFAQKMSMETALKVAGWIERELDRVRPERLVVQFFGGEPLLNLPAMYAIAGRAWAAAGARGVEMKTSIITNGLLLTGEVVDRMIPFGLKGVKVTLDGDRDAHNRMRPLRGGQGTFDRIVENIRRVADRVPISIGGNFDEQSAGSFPALLDFLREQQFADKLVKVNFKPVVRTAEPAAAVSRPKGVFPLTLVSGDNRPLGGTCMTTAGAGGGLGKACDSCNVLDDQMTTLRSEIKRHGFPTPDGVHNGPCHLHMRHAHTIGPDGSLYACPGFTGELSQSTGHIDDRPDPARARARERFDALDPWRECGDCAFIPVCAGGCLVASHTELGDANLPTCHKRTYESALIALAHEAAGAA
ncbi:MAG: radical SAM protein [Acidobacteria bacterium]|nr:radical SAM protein [Acidobacteriota bacterium]